MRRGSNMIGSALNINKCFEILAGTQLEPFSGGIATRFKFFLIWLLVGLYEILSK